MSAFVVYLTDYVRAKVKLEQDGTSPRVPRDHLKCEPHFAEPFTFLIVSFTALLGPCHPN